MRFLFFLCDILNLKSVSRNQNYPGEWELGLSAILENQQIFLIKDEPKAQGYAWLNQKFHQGNWTVNTTIHLPNIKDEIHFGLWFTKNFGIQGPIFGGPQSFYGLSILGMYSNSSLSIEIREDDSQSRLNIGFFPTFFAQTQNTSIHFDIDFHNPYLSVFVTFVSPEKGKVTEQIFHDRLRIKLSKPFFSITAKSFKFPAYVLIEKVEIPEGITNNEITIPSQIPSTLDNISNVTIKSDKIHDQKWVPIALDCFVDLVNGAFSMATPDDIEKTIIVEVIPFSQAWQRRSLYIKEQSHNLSLTLKDQLQNATDVFKNYKNFLHQYMMKMNGQIHDILSELYFGILDSYNITVDLKESKKEGNSKLSTVFLIIGILELFAIAFLVIFDEMKKILK